MKLKELKPKQLERNDNAVCVWCNRMMFIDRRFFNGQSVVRACTKDHAELAFDKPFLAANKL